MWKFTLKKTSRDVELGVKWRVAVQNRQQEDDSLRKFAKKKHLITSNYTSSDESPCKIVNKITTHCANLSRNLVLWRRIRRKVTACCAKMTTRWRLNVQICQEKDVLKRKNYKQTTRHSFQRVITSDDNSERRTSHRRKWMTQQKHHITNHFCCETCQKIIKGIILPPTRTSHHFRWYLSPTEVNESAHFRQTTTQCFLRYQAVPTRWTGSTPLGITSGGTTGTYNQRPHSCFPPRSVPPQTGTPTYWTGSTPTGKS